MPRALAVAEDLGTLRNSLGILSPDRTRIVPEKFLEATHLSATMLSDKLNVKRPTLYRKTIPIPSSRQREMIQLVLATDLVFELTRSLPETGKWLMSPSSILFGDSPFEVILRGDGNAIIAWLNQRTGKVAGAAF